MCIGSQFALLKQFGKRKKTKIINAEAENLKKIYQLANQVDDKRKNGRWNFTKLYENKNYDPKVH